MSAALAVAVLDAAALVGAASPGLGQEVQVSWAHAISCCCGMCGANWGEWLDLFTNLPAHAGHLILLRMAFQSLNNLQQAHR